MHNSESNRRQPPGFWERLLLPIAVLVLSVLFWAAVVLSIQDMLGLVEATPTMINSIGVAGN